MFIIMLVMFIVAAVACCIPLGFAADEGEALPAEQQAREGAITQ